MEFGRVPFFQDIDYSLPRDGNHSVAAEVSNSLKIFLGAPVWGNTELIAKVSKKSGAKGNSFEVYSSYFNAIEFNSSFYALPSKDQVKKWKEGLSKEFLFCPKFPKEVSHFQGDFSILDESIVKTIKTFIPLGGHLGPFFIQFPETFTPQKIDFLQKFLQRFPISIPLAIELRSHLFFKESYAKTIWEILGGKNICWLITDTPGRRDMLHMKMNTDWMMVRFVANSLHQSDFERIDEWIEKVRLWKKKGLKKLYFFLHQPNEAHCFELSEYFRAKTKNLVSWDNNWKVEEQQSFL